MNDNSSFPASAVALLCSPFAFGLLWGWYLGRKFEQQRRIAHGLSRILSKGESQR